MNSTANKECGVTVGNSEWPDDEYDYYIVHDSIGVSHVIRTRKNAHPTVACVGCSD